MNMKLREVGSAARLVVTLAVAGLAGTLLAACADANSKTEPAAPSAPSVATAVVIEKPVAETQEFSGRLEAVEVVEIRPRVSGYITSINFQPGGKVRKGDVLFVIDPRPYQVEADRAAAAAHAARAKADLARLELQRAEKLAADRAIAQRELDERVALQKELEADARAAQAQLEAARLNLSYTRVTAPIDGRASKAEITVGNLVDASAVLTSLVSLDRIYASFDGDEATYLRLGAHARRAQGATVRIGLAHEEGFPHVGKLEFVDNRLDARTGSVRMRALLANPASVLAPGLFARVQVSGGAADKAVLIDERAIGTDQNRKYVIVVGAGNKAEYRPVTLGPAAEGLRVVRSGLAAGERIVVSGLQRVQPGSVVNAATVAMDAPQIAMAEQSGSSDQSGTAK